MNFYKQRQGYLPHRRWIFQKNGILGTTPSREILSGFGRGRRRGWVSPSCTQEKMVDLRLATFKYWSIAKESWGLLLMLMMRRNVKYDLIRFYGQQSNQFLRLGPVFWSQASINLETGSPTQKIWIMLKTVSSPSLWLCITIANISSKRNKTAKIQA